MEELNKIKHIRNTEKLNNYLSSLRFYDIDFLSLNEYYDSNGSLIISVNKISKQIYVHVKLRDKFIDNRTMFDIIKKFTKYEDYLIGWKHYD